MSNDARRSPTFTTWAMRQPAMWATLCFTLASAVALTAPASRDPVGRVAVTVSAGGR